MDAILLSTSIQKAKPKLAKETEKIKKLIVAAQKDPSFANVKKFVTTEGKDKFTTKLCNIAKKDVEDKSDLLKACQSVSRIHDFLEPCSKDSKKFKDCMKFKGLGSP